MLEQCPSPLCSSINRSNHSSSHSKKIIDSIDLVLTSFAQVYYTYIRNRTLKIITFPFGIPKIYWRPFNILYLEAIFSKQDY